jgi:hypothetical protein
MPVPVSNFRLNDLLIDIGRSLVQYAGESWPWAPREEADEQAVVERIVAAQRESAHRIAELLAARGHRIDPGTYPTEYTSLHYVALDYLLGLMVRDQQDIVAECEALAPQARDDPEAAPLLAEIARSERRHPEELQSLLSRRSARQPA